MQMDDRPTPLGLSRCKTKRREETPTSLCTGHAYIATILAVGLSSFWQGVEGGHGQPNGPGAGRWAARVESRTGQARGSDGWIDCMMNIHMNRIRWSHGLKNVRVDAEQPATDSASSRARPFVVPSARKKATAEGKEEKK
jgi:hypothetical protein